MKAPKPPAKIAREPIPSIFKDHTDPKSILALFDANMNAMREYYRAKDDSGSTMPGLNVSMEMVLGHVLTALRDALNGKTWQPPS